MFEFVSLDIETTGLSLESEVLEIGAKHYPSGLEFNCMVDWPCVKFEKGALELHLKTGFLSEWLATKDKFPWCQALEMFHSFLEPFGRITVAGKNAAGFDLPILRHAGFKGNVGFRVLDVGSVLVNGKDEAIPSLQECCKRCDVPYDRGHRAIEDARMVYECLLKGVKDV